MIEARDGFGVMIQEVRIGVDDHGESIPISLKVWNEYFDRTAGAVLPRFMNAPGKDARTAVGKIITVDGGNHDMLEFEVANSSTESPWFIVVNDTSGFALRDSTKHAASRTHIT